MSTITAKNYQYFYDLVSLPLNPKEKKKKIGKSYTKIEHQFLYIRNSILLD